MLQLADNYEQVRSPRSEAGAVPQLDLLAIVRMLYRRWRMLAVIMAIGLALGTLYMATAKRHYSADFSILVEPPKSSLLARDDSSAQRTLDPGVVESQVEVLKSDTVALMAVRALDLTKDPTVMGTGPGLIASLLSYFTAHQPPTQEQLEQNAVDAITTAFKATRVGVTYVIMGTYTNIDPDRTVQIANALANAYIDSELESRYEATLRSTTWLQTRLKALRQETSTAELAVQKFKVDNGIVDTARGLMSDQQLTDATTQLATAHNDTTAAKARLDRIQEVLKNSTVVNATVPDALKDDILNRLRAQYLDLSSRLSDLTARFGPNHGVVLTLRSQINEIEKSARDELGRVAESSRSEYEIAASNERALKSNLDVLVTQSDTSSKAQIKLRDLESTAQTYRSLYDNMLQKLQEVTQEQTSPNDSARIINPASPPGGPSSPKLVIVMAAAVLGSLLLGCGTALALELLGNNFKTPEDVKNYAGLECLGTLPRVTISQATRRALQRAAPPSSTVLGLMAPVARQTLLAPFSRFTETIRNVKVSIDIARTGRGAAVTGIVSSVPKEGKTTFTSNLALVTAQMGHRTLLIDGDMHSPSLTKTLYPNARLGLIDLLEGRCTVEQAIIHDETTRLEFVPTVVRERKPNTVSLLTSNAMVDLLAAAREHYDYVFIDLPPIVPVVDVKASAQMFDNFVFVLEWGRTSRDVVRDALITSEQIRQRVIGAVMNKADPLELKRIESYRGAEYGSYYIESGT